jgi:4-hydroxy-tetrahydrodipicolinate synthase
MLKLGVYPAAVTPFDSKNRVDFEGLSKLLSWFESEGCTGVVLAGTNGEGPSLSAPEKRDIAINTQKIKGNLDLILGVATPSLDEAIWLCKQAAAAQCVAVLLMAPYYFRDATTDGIIAWFTEVLDRSPVDIIIYNFPQRTGVTITPEMLGVLAKHPRCVGVKDSSGSVENLVDFRESIPEGKCLFVGNEGLLIDALKKGWSGTISGVANVLPDWMSQIVKEYHSGEIESAEEKHRIVLPIVEAMRKCPQPAMNKAILAEWGVLPQSLLRLPLVQVDEKEVKEIARLIRGVTGRS